MRKIDKILNYLSLHGPCNAKTLHSEFGLRSPGSALKREIIKGQVLVTYSTASHARRPICIYEITETGDLFINRKFVSANQCSAPVISSLAAFFIDPFNLMNRAAA